MPSKPGSFQRLDAVHELKSIADWWLTNTLDHRHGGFVGEVDYHGKLVPEASKGIILNSRILWFFSEASRFEDHPEYRMAADRAFRYLLAHFDDREHGGAFWEIAADGALINGKKQIYALCFCIYALVAYYRLTSNQAALSKSLEYFHTIEKCARDRDYHGYFEAFSRKWEMLGDVRLGETDMNAPKTMNTHLHLLEAYTALHRAARCEETEEALRNILGLFCDHFIDHDNAHLKLFFDTRWNSLSSLVSFGHDIEASWLLWEAAAVLSDPDVLSQIKPIAVRMADACQREGIAGSGYLCDEYDPNSQHRSEHGVWWVQAEALVGFLNAFKLTGEQKFRDSCNAVWHYIQNHHIDSDAGEWHGLSAAPDTDIKAHYKAGFWKAPYHNGRAMMEACRLFDDLKET